MESSKPGSQKFRQETPAEALRSIFECHGFVRWSFDSVTHFMERGSETKPVVDAMAIMTSTHKDWARVRIAARPRSVRFWVGMAAYSIPFAATGAGLKEGEGQSLA
jgi:hypothetical protein